MCSIFNCSYSSLYSLFSALSVLCWNVLAHMFTHHNANAHGNGAMSTEAEAQLRTRLDRNARIIAEQYADVMMLQGA